MTLIRFLWCMTTELIDVKQKQLPYVKRWKLKRVSFETSLATDSLTLELSAGQGERRLYRDGNLAIEKISKI